MILRRIPGGLVLCATLWLACCGPISTLNSTAEQKDPEQAQVYYRQGMAHIQGVTVPQDYSRALDFFIRSARLGSHNAAYMAAMAYVTGRGTDQDFAAAARWLETAAREGHVKSQYQLSILYLNGRGVEQDRIWAMYLASLAAHKEHKQAAFNVGVGYASGLGLPENSAAAWYWLVRAERAGIENAAALRQKMQQRSTSGQRQRMTDTIRISNSRNPDRATAIYLQQQLKRMGYLKGAIDGVWGKQSQAAYQAFTRDELLLSDVAIDWSILELMRQ